MALYWAKDMPAYDAKARRLRQQALTLCLCLAQGSWIVNNARGAIVNVDDVNEACESGQLGGAWL